MEQYGTELRDAKRTREDRWTPALLGGAMVCYILTGLMAAVMLLGQSSALAQAPVLPDGTMNSGTPQRDLVLPPRHEGTSSRQEAPMDAVDWDIVATYGVIESMTAESPTLSHVDHVLERLPAPFGHSIVDCCRPFEVHFDRP